MAVLAPGDRVTIETSGDFRRPGSSRAPSSEGRLVHSSQRVQLEPPAGALFQCLVERPSRSEAEEARNIGGELGLLVGRREELRRQTAAREHVEAAGRGPAGRSGDPLVAPYPRLLRGDLVGSVPS